MLLRYNTTTPIQIQTLNQANPRCLQPFSPLGDVDDNAIPFAEAGEPRSFKGRDMHEHVLAAAVPSDKAVAPLGVKPFHRSGLLDQRIGGWPTRRCGSIIRSSRRRRRSGAWIDAQYLGDMRPP